MSSQEAEWLSNGFLEMVLKKSTSDRTIEIKNVTMKAATATGDNYLSDMIRANVEYNRKEADRTILENISLIIKVAPHGDGFEKDLVQGLRAFDTEIRMMEQTLVEMNDIINEEDYRFNARSLFTKCGDPALVVMEDLAAIGFRMADRERGLDLQHSLLAMKRLAKFHAASVVLCEKDPKSMNEYNRGIYHEDNPEKYKKFYKDACVTVANEVDEWTEMGSDRYIFAEKLRKLSEICYRECTKCYKRKDNEFNVLNHGDFWVNNMLFRYDEKGAVIDHIFVDFQLAVWTSPTLDLMYFLNTSINDNVELHHREDLIKEYLNVLISTMAKLRCKTKPPSLSDLKKSMREREFLGVITSCLVLPFILVDKNEATGADVVFNKGEDYVNPAYKGQAYRKRLIDRFSGWNSRGLLNF